MARRVIASALFLVLALAIPSVCLELCIDDEVGPCVHSLTAILDEVHVAAPPAATLSLSSQQKEPSPSALPADIFHVPLLG
jgi:hypothetical protein